MFRLKSTPSRANAPVADQFTVLAPHYDELMQVVPYTAWVEYVMLLWSIVEFKPQTILDCACGTGNVSFELARHGYDVTGVDISEGMVVAARAKAKSAQLAGKAGKLAFQQGDLTDFDLKSTFDGATCLYDSFNYILDPLKLQAAFACIAQHIKPGGVFIFDMNTPWAFEANLFTQRNHDPRKALHYDWKARFDIATKVCEVEMLFEKKDESGKVATFSEVHRERAYSQSEVTAMLIQGGWQLLKIYDAYTLNAPHERSERWYFVARRIAS